MSAETQKVDVLAVMDRLIELSSSEFNRRRDAGASSGDLHLLAGRTNAAIEARAAVSELIERVDVLREQRGALEYAMRTIRDIASERAIDYMAARYRVRTASEAALARVGGAE